MRCVGAEVAASPFGMELQFDVLSDGALGQTVGVSARFPFVPASAGRLLSIRFPKVSLREGAGIFVFVPFGESVGGKDGHVLSSVSAH